MIIKNKNFILLFLCVMVCFVAPSDIYAQKKNKKNKTQKNISKTNDKNDFVVTNLFIDAIDAINRNDISLATEKLEQCLIKNPKHSASNYQLSKIYTNKAQFSEAEKYALLAYNANPENKWYQLNLMNIYKETKEYKKYLKIAHQYNKTYPNDPEIPFDMAYTYILLEDGKNAIDCYNKVEDIIGLTENISVQKYNIYLLLKDENKAINEINKILEVHPEKASYYYAMIAEMYIKNNENSKAFEYYKKISESDPNDPYINITLADFYKKNGQMELANKELKKGFANPDLEIKTKLDILFKFYEAIDFSKEEENITELFSIILKTHPNDAGAHYLFGTRKLILEDYKSARENFLNAIKIDSTNYNFWRELISADFELQDFESIENHSKRAIKLFPMQANLYGTCGQALAFNKKYSEAIEYFEKGLKVIGNDKDLKYLFYNSLGELYKEIDDYAMSDKNYDKAIEIKPNEPTLLNNYAYNLAVRNERLDDALKMSEKSLELDPDNSFNMDTYGWILYQKKDYNNALIWIKKAIKHSESPSIEEYDHLGDVYLKLGNNNEALKNWKKALEIEPDNDTIKQKIENLK